MKPYLLVIRPALTAVSLLALSLTLAIALVVGLLHYRTAHRDSLARAEATLQASHQEVNALAADLASLETHLARFKHLVALGLIGDPNRDAWVHDLEEIYSTLQLPPTLRYALSAPQPLAETAATSSPTPTMIHKAWRHDLDIELSGLHEGELLGFLEALRAKWQAPFRLEECSMTRETAGLKIKCTLCLFSLPGTTVATSTRGQRR